jgi:hypothetical protein
MVLRRGNGLHRPHGSAPYDSGVLGRERCRRGRSRRRRAQTRLMLCGCARRPYGASLAWPHGWPQGGGCRWPLRASRCVEEARQLAGTQACNPIEAPRAPESQCGAFSREPSQRQPRIHVSAGAAPSLTDPSTKIHTQSRPLCDAEPNANCGYLTTRLGQKLRRALALLAAI